MRRHTDLHDITRKKNKRLLKSRRLSKVQGLSGWWMKTSLCCKMANLRPHLLPKSKPLVFQVKFPNSLRETPAFAGPLHVATFKRLTPNEGSHITNKYPPPIFRAKPDRQMEGSRQTNGGTHAARRPSHRSAGSRIPS